MLMLWDSVYYFGTRLRSSEWQTDRKSVFGVNILCFITIKLYDQEDYMYSKTENYKVELIKTLKIIY